MSSKKGVDVVPSSADKPTAFDVARLITGVENPPIKLIRGIERCIPIILVHRESTEQLPKVTDARKSIQNILHFAKSLKETNENGIAWHFLRGALPDNDFPEYEERENFLRRIVERAEGALAALPTGKIGAKKIGPMVHGKETNGIEGKLACAAVVSVAWTRTYGSPPLVQDRALPAAEILWEVSGGSKLGWSTTASGWRSYFDAARNRDNRDDIKALTAQIEMQFNLTDLPT